MNPSFMLCYPFVGCCFCCCRMCGACGGKRVQKQPSNFKCICMTVTLDISITILFAGCIMAITMNDRMSFSIDYFEDAINDNLDDIGLFLNTTADEVEQIGLGGFNFTSDVLERDMSSIDYTLGLPIRDYLGYNLSVYQILDDTVAMDTSIDDTITQMTHVNNNQTEWAAALSDLDTELLSLRTDLGDSDALAHAECQADAACDSLYGTIALLETLADPAAMPDWSAYITSLSDIQSTSSLTESVEESRTGFDNIPDQLKNDTTEQVDDAISDLRHFFVDIDKNLEDIRNLTDNQDSIDKLKDSLDNTFSTIKDMDKYRSAGFLVCVVLIFCITSLWFLGALIGPCCYSSKRPPTERNCCSNCAGVLLMSGAGLAWIFSVLFMLLTFILFLFGYPLHKLVCEPLTDPEYAAFKDLFDEPDSLLSKDGYFMGELVFNNGTINLTLSGVLENCRHNEPAYQALLLHNLIDLGQITNWEDSMNLTEIFDSMTTDITNIVIMSNETETILIDMRDTLADLNYTIIKQALQTDTTATNLSTYSTDLRAVISSGAVTDSTVLSNLDTAADTLDAIIAAEYATAVTTQTNEYDSVVILEDIAGDVPSDIDQLIADADTVEALLASNGSAFVADRVAVFTDRETGAVDSFANYVSDQFQTDMARCKPLWNVWDSLIVSGLCDLTIGTINGVWFAFGWCTFFMFISTIFSIKLAKYFRKMKYEEGEEDYDEDKADEEKNDEEQPSTASQWQYPAEKRAMGPPPVASSFPPPANKFTGGPNAYPHSPPPAYPTAAAARNLNF